MEFIQLLGELSELLTQSMRKHKLEVLGQEGLQKLTMIQYYYLEAVHKLHHPTYSDLARRFNVSKPSVTNIVNRLIQEGFVEKIQSGSDKRVFHLHLTELGKGLLAADQKAHEEMAGHILANLTSEEATDLQHKLRRIIDSAKK